MVTCWNEILALARQRGPRTVVVAGAGHEPLLLALREAWEMEIARPVLVDTGERLAALPNLEPDADWPRITAPEDRIEAVAVKTVRELPGSLLMKGRRSTAPLLKAVLDRHSGLRCGKLLSHVAVVETPDYHKLLFFTDGGVNLYPDTDTLEHITRNALEFVSGLGIDNPRVALVTLVEQPAPGIQSTLNAGRVASRLQNEMLIEGPVSIDIALSPESARLKGVTSHLSGEVDIIVGPSASTTNIAVKILSLLGRARTGGIVVGAAVPVILLSRADDAHTRLRSIALGVAAHTSSGG